MRSHHDQARVVVLDTFRNDGSGIAWLRVYLDMEPGAGDFQAFALKIACRFAQRPFLLSRQDGWIINGRTCNKGLFGCAHQHKRIAQALPYLLSER